MTDDQIAFSIKQMKDYGLVDLRRRRGQGHRLHDRRAGEGLLRQDGQGQGGQGRPRLSRRSTRPSSSARASAWSWRSRRANRYQRTPPARSAASAYSAGSACRKADVPSPVVPVRDAARRRAPATARPLVSLRVDLEDLLQRHAGAQGHVARRRRRASSSACSAPPAAASRRRCASSPASASRAPARSSGPAPTSTRRGTPDARDRLRLPGADADALGDGRSTMSGCRSACKGVVEARRRAADVMEALAHGRPRRPSPMPIRASSPAA